VTFENQISTFNSFSGHGVEKIFSPPRYVGTEPDKNGKENSAYQGRSAAVVSDRTPFIFKFHIEKQRVSDTFYIQRYTTHSFINILLFPALVSSIDCEGK